MSKYAVNTSVSVEASEAEIKATLRRFGVMDAFSGTLDGRAQIMFKYNGQPYCIAVILPDPNDNEFQYTPSQRKQRTQDQAYAAWEQGCRVKWRELALVIKAKLVAISNEAVSFEDEFLAYAMLPNRTGYHTFGDWANKQLQGFIQAGETPALVANCPRGER